MQGSDNTKLTYQLSNQLTLLCCLWENDYIYFQATFTLKEVLPI